MILSTLKEMVANCDTQNPGKLRVLIVSQIYSDIAKCLSTSDPRPEIVSIDIRSVERDIKAFVDNECTELQRTFHLTPEQASGISEMTCNGSQGISIGRELQFQALTLFGRDVLVCGACDGKSPKTEEPQGFHEGDLAGNFPSTSRRCVSHTLN